jgi:predicted nucleic-acid-binding protein
MHAVDTNVLVRLFVNDNARQFAAARQVVSAQPTFIAKTVIVEFEWVLRGVYGYSRAAIVSALESVLASGDVELEDSASIVRALDWFRRGMDLADAVHLASSPHVDSFVTFDASMRRRAVALVTKPPVVAP